MIIMEQKLLQTFGNISRLFIVTWLENKEVPIKDLKLEQNRLGL